MGSGIRHNNQKLWCHIWGRSQTLHYLQHTKGYCQHSLWWWNTTSNSPQYWLQHLWQYYPTRASCPMAMCNWSPLHAVTIPFDETPSIMPPTPTPTLIPAPPRHSACLAVLGTTHWYNCPINYTPRFTTTTQLLRGHDATWPLVANYGYRVGQSEGERCVWAGRSTPWSTCHLLQVGLCKQVRCWQKYH